MEWERPTRRGDGRCVDSQQQQVWGGGGDWRGTVVVEEVVGDGGLVISCGARPFRRGEGTGDVARFPRLTRLGGAHAGRASPNSVQCNVGHTTLAHSFMIRTI
jgi:hypothetical protein